MYETVGYLSYGFFYVSKMVMCAVLVVFSLRGRAQSSVMMEKETCAFLQSLPAGLQKTQADAVRRAINGDCTALISVRNSRNTKPESKSEVVTKDIGGCYRLYRPAGFDTIPLPVLIYLHGGGWCFGSINSCAHFCAELSYRAKIAVLAVEYPLAPEHAYPAALNACTEAVAFAFEHAGEYGFFPDRISIGGDSSGGNLALATALNLILAKDSHSCRMDSGTMCSSLCSLVLFYPVTKSLGRRFVFVEKLCRGIWSRCPIDGCFQCRIHRYRRCSPASCLAGRSR